MGKRDVIPWNRWGVIGECHSLNNMITGICLVTGKTRTENSLRVLGPCHAPYTELMSVLSQSARKVCNNKDKETALMVKIAQVQRPAWKTHCF
jgi:hypothetical protein